MERPVSRRLRVLAFDPSLTLRLETAALNEITVEVQWDEGLNSAPIGGYVEVIDADPASGALCDSLAPVRPVITVLEQELAAADTRVATVLRVPLRARIKVGATSVDHRVLSRELTLAVCRAARGRAGDKLSRARAARVQLGRTATTGSRASGLALVAQAC